MSRMRKVSWISYIKNLKTISRSRNSQCRSLCLPKIILKFGVWTKSINCTHVVQNLSPLVFRDWSNSGFCLTLTKCRISLNVISRLWRKDSMQLLLKIVSQNHSRMIYTFLWQLHSKIASLICKKWAKISIKSLLRLLENMGTVMVLNPW